MKPKDILYALINIIVALALICVAYTLFVMTLALATTAPEPCVKIPYGLGERPRCVIVEFKR